MNRLAEKILHSAWEPFTPRGVVTYTRASVGRLLFVQLLMAIAAAAAVTWFVATAWFPVVEDAVHHLPAEGSVSHAALAWRGDTPERLAANSFLSFAVDIWHEGGLSREAQIAIEFGGKDIQFHSLLGYTDCPYPDGWVIPANQPGLEPWWNSRAPWLLAGIAASTVIILLFNWFVFATLYCPFFWLLAYFTNRNIGWSGSWKLCGAALMPGALFMTLCIVAYGLGLVGLARLALGTAFHFLIGWIYLCVCPALLPRVPEVAKARPNPFAK
jgi:hypothetical protein